MSAPGLALTAYRSVARITVVLSGELDMVSAPDLRIAVRRLCELDASELLLDLDRLEFLDSAGLRSLEEARLLWVERASAFFLTRGGAQVKRLLEITGAVAQFSFLDPVPERGERLSLEPE